MYFNQKSVRKAVDKVIPYALIILLVITLFQVFFPEKAEPYIATFHFIDLGIISIFVLDLYFKYQRSKTIPLFLKSSWMDIIAVLPFFLIARIIEEALLLAQVGDIVETVDQVIELEHDSIKLVKQAEKEAKFIRVRYLNRFLRPLARSPRFVKAFTFFERPHVNIKPFHLKINK